MRLHLSPDIFDCLFDNVEQGGKGHMALQMAAELKADTEISQKRVTDEYVVEADSDDCADSNKP